jgi:hypothetical protein
LHPDDISQDAIRVTSEAATVSEESRYLREKFLREERRSRVIQDAKAQLSSLKIKQDEFTRSGNLAAADFINYDIEKTRTQISLLEERRDKEIQVAKMKLGTLKTKRDERVRSGNLRAARDLENYAIKETRALISRLEEERAKSVEKQPADHQEAQQDIKSKDDYPNSRSAEPETKRETKRPDKFDPHEWTTMLESQSFEPREAKLDGRDFFSTPNSGYSSGPRPSQIRIKRSDRERPPRKSQIPHQQSYDRSQSTGAGDSSDEALSKLNTKASLPKAKPIASTQPKRRAVPGQRRTGEGTGGGTSMPPSAPNLKNFETSFEQVGALSSYFQSTLLPLCNEYVANIPTNQKTREWEHRKLTESILSQVLMHSDGIEASDEPTRAARRKLVREAQATLKRVDDAFGTIIRT